MGKETRGFFLRLGTEVFVDLSENDEGNIFLPFDRVEVDVFLLLHCLPESGGIGIVPDMNRRDPVSELAVKSDQGLQVGNLHVGNDEEVQVLLSLDERNQIFEIEGRSSNCTIRM